MSEKVATEGRAPFFILVALRWVVDNEKNELCDGWYGLRETRSNALQSTDTFYTSEKNQERKRERKRERDRQRDVRKWEKDKERDRQRDVRKWETESVCMLNIYRERQR